MRIMLFNAALVIHPLSFVERNTLKDPPQTPIVIGICGGLLLFVSRYQCFISLCEKKSVTRLA